MVVMSLVKSPIARILLFGERTAKPVVAAAPICSIADAALPADPGVVPPACENVARWNREHREKCNGRTAAALDSNFGRCGICTACDSRRRSKAEAGVVKGCTTTRFCLMGLCKWSDWPPFTEDRFDGLSTCCRPAGRTNAPTADHAWAWFQETDRLETAGDRREPPYHRLRDHDAGPHPQGRRYRRDPDCADGDTARPHRARRAVCARRVLYADVL